MNTRLIVPAILGAVMLSTPVLALGIASPEGHPHGREGEAEMALQTSSERCTVLQDEFDAAIKKHETAAKAADAKKLRSEGGTLCNSGRDDEGIAKLKTAMRELGVRVTY